MELVGRLSTGRLNSTFTLTTPRGVVRGTANAPVRIKDGVISFRGTAKITGATRAYRGARSLGITFAGSTDSLRSFSFTLKGRVRY